MKINLLKVTVKKIGYVKIRKCDIKNAMSDLSLQTKQLQTFSIKEF